MIPIKLTIEGLYSYQKRQTIDFTKLTAANIFGIFGQVGSGKSSILEAISYAIYGNTERLNSKESRGYNMMNLKSDTLFIGFEFYSGITKSSYLVEVSTRRNSKRFEDVKTIERKAFVDDKGSWVPIEVGVLEKAVGLSYANFKRTIIIPQGKFQEFLQLDKSERTIMMKELFNLEKYDLFRKAASLDKRNNEKRQYLEGQISTLGDVSAEQINELKVLLSVKNEEVKVVTEKLSDVRTALAEWIRLKELETKKELLTAERLKAESKSEEVNALENRLREYEYCTVHFKTLLEQELLFSTNISNLSATILKDKKELDEVLSKQAAYQKQHTELLPLYENREQHNREAEDIKRLSEIRRLEVEIVHQKERAKKGQDAIDKKIADVATLKAQHEQLQKEIKELRNSIPDGNTISAAREWYAALKSLTNQLQEAKKEQAQNMGNILAAEEKLKHIIDTNNLNTEGAKLSMQNAQKSITSLIVAGQNTIAERDKELEHLLIRHKLGEYASELHDGKPCPLCGSLSHPNVLDTDNVEEAISIARQVKANTEENIRRYTALDKSLSELAAIHNSALEAGDKSAARVEKLQIDINSHQQKFIWTDYSTEESINLAIKSSENLTIQISSKETELEKKSALLKEEEQNAEKYRKAVEIIVLDTASKEGQLESLSKSLTDLKVSDYKDSNQEELAALASKKQAATREAVNLYETTTTLLNNLKVQEAKVRGSIDTNNANLSKETVSLNDTKGKIEAELAGYGQKSLEEVKSLLALNINADETRTLINNHRLKLKTIAAQLEDNEKEFNGKAYNADIHTMALEQERELVQKAAEAGKETGRIESEIRAKSMAAEQLAIIRIELDKTIQRAADLSTLKSMLQGNKFIDFVSTNHLQNLCSTANERFFKMTRQRLSLELTEENSFQVRDYMNGGKTRNVKTLSGGQTFQASLALALALSDNIQRMQSADQNFFFLDEGFGTLDKESLSTVFDTLKSLRKENRIVGIISHVEELQQEIETYLKVVNHEENGSLVSTSWM